MYAWTWFHTHPNYYVSVELFHESTLPRLSTPFSNNVCCHVPRQKSNIMRNMIGQWWPRPRKIFSPPSDFLQTIHYSPQSWSLDGKPVLRPPWSVLLNTPQESTIYQQCSFISLSTVRLGRICEHLLIETYLTEVSSLVRGWLRVHAIFFYLPLLSLAGTLVLW